MIFISVTIIYSHPAIKCHIWYHITDQNIFTDVSHMTRKIAATLTCKGIFYLCNIGKVSCVWNPQTSHSMSMTPFLRKNTS